MDSIIVKTIEKLRRQGEDLTPLNSSDHHPLFTKLVDKLNDKCGVVPSNNIKFRARIGAIYRKNKKRMQWSDESEQFSSNKKAEKWEEKNKCEQVIGDITSVNDDAILDANATKHVGPKRKIKRIETPKKNRKWGGRL